MEKKLISIFVAFIFASVSLFAQDYEAKGDAAIKRGDYSTAIENFEAQLSYLKFKKVDVNSREYLMLEKKCSKATECKTLRSKASSIVKKLNIDFYDVLSSLSKNKGDEMVVTWKANIKSLSNTYNSILSRFPNDANTKSLLEAAGKYQPQIDQAYFDAYTMPEKWASVQKDGTKEAYQAFLDEFPEGRFADLAYQAIHKQEDDALWATALSENTKDSYEAYIKSMPRGAYVTKATDIIIQIVEDSDFWTTAMEVNSIEGYNAYLNNRPNGFNKLKASANLKVLQAKKDYDSGLSLSCSSKLNSFRALCAEPASLLIEQNIPVYIKISEGVDYSAWNSNKNYINAKNYLDTHPDGEHYAEVANYFAVLIADSWDLLPPNASPEQISYIMSLSQDSAVIAYVQDKISANNKLNETIEASNYKLASYSGKSRFYGYDKSGIISPVAIYINDKPEKMAPVKIYVDGQYVGDNLVNISITSGYHTILLQGWDYTKAANYESHKDTPTHTTSYVIKVDNTTSKQSYGLNCPGGGSFRSKKAFSVVGQVVVYTAVIGGAIAAAAIGKK